MSLVTTGMPQPHDQGAGSASGVAGRHKKNKRGNQKAKEEAFLNHNDTNADDGEDKKRHG